MAGPNMYDFSDPSTYAMGSLGSVGTGAIQAQVAPVAAPSVAGAAVPGVAAPGAVGVPGQAGQGTGFWQPGGGATIALGAIQTLGSLWNSFQQNSVAKKSLGLQTRAFEENLANTKDTYNTNLEDRIRSRYEGMSGGTQEQATQYINDHKL